MAVPRMDFVVASLAGVAELYEDDLRTRLLGGSIVGRRTASGSLREEDVMVGPGWSLTACGFSGQHPKTIHTP